MKTITIIKNQIIPMLFFLAASLLIAFSPKAFAQEAQVMLQTTNAIQLHSISASVSLPATVAVATSQDETISAVQPVNPLAGLQAKLNRAVEEKSGHSFEALRRSAALSSENDAVSRFLA